MARPQRTTRDVALNATRERLLQAAAAEFAAEGYTRANINRISTEAGFAKGTIYNHFASKRALVQALIDETAAGHVSAIVAEVEQEVDPMKRLERFFRAGFDFVERHPKPSRVIINMVYGPDEALKNKVYKAYERLFDLLTHDIIEAGIAQNQFRKIDPDVTAAMLMTIYLGSCSQLTADGKIWLDPAHIMSFVLDGLRRCE
jgi:AcrR family transcriptional regulator